MRPTVNFRLSDEAKKLLAEVAARSGLSRTAVIELLIRRFGNRLVKQLNK